MSEASSDRTRVAGFIEQRGPKPKRGDVVGGRYEIRGRLRDDVFSFGYLTRDVRTQVPALLRVLRPGLLDDPFAQAATLDKLQDVVGVRGRYLPGLISAGQHAGLLYTSEEVPVGVSLRDVFDRRNAAGRPLTARELLPVVTRLATALGEVPAPWHHGEVRAEHVWVDPEAGLRLSGAFLLAAMPAGLLAAMLQTDRSLRRMFAPEVFAGRQSKAADRFGIGAIAFEALTLRLPRLETDAPLAETQGAVGQAIDTLLSNQPKQRTSSAERLCAALRERVQRASAPPTVSTPSSTHRERTSVLDIPLSSEKTHIITDQALIEEFAYVEEPAPPPPPRPKAPAQLQAPPQPQTPPPPQTPTAGMPRATPQPRAPSSAPPPPPARPTNGSPSRLSAPAHHGDPGRRAIANAHRRDSQPADAHRTRDPRRSEPPVNHRVQSRGMVAARAPERGERFVDTLHPPARSTTGKIVWTGVLVLAAVLATLVYFLATR